MSEEREVPSNWKDWPTAASAGRRLGVSRTKVQAMTKSGELNCQVRCPDNTIRYDPDVIDAIAENLGSLPERDDDDSDGDATKPLIAPRIAADGFRAGTELTKQAHKHLETMVGLLVSPIRQALEVLERQCAKLQERNEKLEALRDDSILAREELLNRKVERDLMLKDHDSTQARKTQAWELFLRSAPKLLEQAAGSIVAKDPQAAEQVSATIELLRDPEMAELIKGLLETDMLNPRQKAMVERIVNPKPNGKTA